MTKNENMGENTEQRILDAAVQIFIRDGLQGARMQDIADLAHINRAMLHYYYRDRESLSQKAFKKITHQFGQSIHKIIDLDIPFDEKLDDYIQEQIKIYSQNSDLVIFGLHESLKDKDIMSKLIKSHIEGKHLLFEQLEEEIKKGRIKQFDKYEFIVFITSLCAFPYIACAIFKWIFNWTEEQYDSFLDSYKKNLPELIKGAIYVNYQK